MKRIHNYKTKWKKLVETYGAMCFYCHEEIATSIDHIIPFSWNSDDSIENMVPACGLCNSIAGDRMFEYVEEKCQYILNHRKRRSRRAICVECLLPYSYRYHSPSLFLCAECYDREYGTHYADQECWKQWERELVAANIFPYAHKYTRIKCGPYKKKKSDVFMSILTDTYAEEIERRIS